jgi:hypothetical protein
MFKPGRQKSRPGRQTDSQAGKQNVRPNRLKRGKESRNRNPHTAIGTILKIKKVFSKKQAEPIFHFSL